MRNVFSSSFVISATSVVETAYDRIQRWLIPGGCYVRAVLGDPTHDFRGVFCGPIGPPRVYPFRGKGNEKIFTRL